MPAQNKTKELLSLLFRIALSLALLIYLFSKIDTAKMTAAVKSADVRFILLAAAVYMPINLFLLLRWFVFIKALDLRVSFKSVVYCFFMGLFFNLFLPTSTGGDIVKAIGLFRDTSEKAKVVASVVADRLTGFVAISFIALISFILGYQFIKDYSLLVSVMILAVLSITVLAILFNERLYSFFCGVFNKFPDIKGKLMNLHYAIALLKGKRRAMLEAVGLSCLSQATFAWVFFLLAESLHQDVRMIYFLIFIPILCVISSLPSIGGLGVRDAGAAYLFSKVGVDPGVSVSMSLINFSFMVFSGLVGGIVYVVAMSSRRPSHKPNVSTST